MYPSTLFGRFYLTYLTRRSQRTFCLTSRCVVGTWLQDISQASPFRIMNWSFWHAGRSVQYELITSIKQIIFLVIYSHTDWLTDWVWLPFFFRIVPSWSTRLALLIYDTVSLVSLLFCRTNLRSPTHNITCRFNHSYTHWLYIKMWGVMSFWWWFLDLRTIYYALLCIISYVRSRPI